uniref:Aa_trans domain-containing protein n=1 Tax=Onchocerca volvulus TaxID=6282 RepID=A0A8R1TIX4_ONCVO
MTTIASLDIDDAAINYGKPNGLHWFTAALFLVADMAGAGIVALPVAMARSGKRFNGTLSICSCILNTVLFGVAVVFCLLASYIINDFIISITNYDIGFCYVLLFVTLAIYPVTLLRSPQDFWWAVVLAMLTTLFSVILILIGSWLDYGKCSSTAFDSRPIHYDAIIASLGTYMFGLGGHVVFPSVQHDMKFPKKFKRSAILAFTAVALIYLPVSLLGYAAYGNSLHDSVINSIQLNDLFFIFDFKYLLIFSTGWIRQFANLFIAIHCILTLTVVINPLNQEVENLVKAPHHFGWHRVFIRTIVILTVLFVAETVPKFGPILNVIGGSTVALTSAILPLLYNNYLNASVHDPITNTYKRPTFIQVLQRNSKSKLLIDFAVIVISVIFGTATTYIAVVEMASTEFRMPCYLFFLENTPRNISANLSLEQLSVCN